MTVRTSGAKLNDIAVFMAVVEAGSYPSPTPAFAILRDHVAFYARPFDRCLVDGQIVTPQESSFYGGWITDRFAGPFKGGPGSAGW